MQRTKIEIERHKRIMLSVYAYAYEIESHSIVSDFEFDRLAEKIDIFMDTGNEIMDNFFLNKFDPSTGMWIHKHPELEKIKLIYEKHFSRYNVKYD